MENDRLDATNPYAPPASDVNATKPEELVTGELAERGTRFKSHLVDILLNLAAAIPGTVVAVQKGVVGQGNVAHYRAIASTLPGIVSILASLTVIGFQAYLVATTGQSIAKKLFRIKIVKVSGAAVGFVSGVLLRHWLLLLLVQIPFVGSALALIDALFIFRENRRCLHDYVAGTKVVQLR